MERGGVGFSVFGKFLVPLNGASNAKFVENSAKGISNCGETGAAVFEGNACTNGEPVPRFAEVAKAKLFARTV